MSPPSPIPEVGSIDRSSRRRWSSGPSIPGKARPLELELLGCPYGKEETLADLVTKLVGRAFEFSQEVRFFTYELSERYEEINLLYSISETLGPSSASTRPPG